MCTSACREDEHGLEKGKKGRKGAKKINYMGNCERCAFGGGEEKRSV